MTAPITSPIVDQNGMVTQVWSSFFNSKDKIVVKTASARASADEKFITLDGSSAIVTYTLPADQRPTARIPETGREFFLACVDSTNAVSVDLNGSTFYSDSGPLTMTAGDYYYFKFDGTRWIGFKGTSTGGVSDHNDLNNIQGGNGTDEYYHLTLADHTEAVAFLNGGTGTHTSYDTHVASTSNPHSVTASQVGNTTAQWNANQINGVGVDNTDIADTKILQYNAGTGNLEYETLPSASPGGSDTHIQYNDSGSFGGGSFFTTNKSSTVTLDGGGLVNTDFNLNGSYDWVLRATPTDTFILRDVTSGVNRMTVSSLGDFTFSGNVDIGSGKAYKINTSRVLEVSGQSTFLGLCNGTTSSTQSTLIGYNVGTVGFTHVQDVLIGNNIANSMSSGGGANVIIGSNTGTSITTSVQSVVIGAGVGTALTSGRNQVFIGSNCGAAVTTASYLIAIGESALRSNVSGTSCLAIGRNSLFSCLASENVGYGASSLIGVTTSPSNIGLGVQSAVGISTGTGLNTCLGSYVGPGVTSTVSYDVHLGALAGYRVTSGTGNIFIGGWCGYGAGNYAMSRSIIIGNDCMRTVTPASDRLYIDVTSGVGASTLIYGEFDNRVLQINGDFYSKEGRRVKTNRDTSNTTLDDSAEEWFGDTDGGAFTYTLPASPVDGRHYRIINCGTSGNNLTIARNGNNLRGGTSDITLLDGDVLILTFETTEGWW